MKGLTTKIVAPFLAVLVLLSTISWSVEKHLCMGRVMDVAFFHDAESCGMDKAMAVIGEAEADNPCCDDESFMLEGQHDLKMSWDELDVDSQVFLTAFAHSYLTLLSVSAEHQIPQETYPPPLLVQDLTILHEVFLI